MSMLHTLDNQMLIVCTNNLGVQLEMHHHLYPFHKHNKELANWKNLYTNDQKNTWNTSVMR